MAPKIDYVVYGTLAAVRAEYSLPDMGEEWFKRWGFRYAIKIIGDAEWDVDFVTNAKDAKSCARDLAKELGVKFSYIGK